MEIIITAFLSVLICSRLLRACRDLADEAEVVCPWMARAVQQAILEPVDAFLEARGYITTARHAEAAQRAFIAVQDHEAAAARVEGLVDHLAQATQRSMRLKAS